MVVALLGLAAGVGAAQTATRPTITLTILAGTATGHGLWYIAKQPLSVLNSPNHDTLTLSRSITSGWVLGVAGTYFLASNVGAHVELSYVGLPFNNSCRLLPPVQPDMEQKNQQICDNLDAEAGSGGAVVLLSGVTVRAASRAAVSPYVRGSIGVVFLSRSTIEVVGDYVVAVGQAERPVIVDASPRRRTPMAGFAAGFTTAISPGYQLRVEARDVVASLERVTGPANNSAVAPVGSRTYHHVSLVLGLDIVLERSRGRRY